MSGEKIEKIKLSKQKPKRKKKSYWDHPIWKMKSKEEYQRMYDEKMAKYINLSEWEEVPLKAPPRDYKPKRVEDCVVLNESDWDLHDRIMAEYEQK